MTNILLCILVVLVILWVSMLGIASVFKNSSTSRYPSMYKKASCGCSSAPVLRHMPVDVECSDMEEIETNLPTQNEHVKTHENVRWDAIPSHELRDIYSEVSEDHISLRTYPSMSPCEKQRYINASNLKYDVQ